MNLEKYKILNGNSGVENYWDLSQKIFDRINSSSSSRDIYVNFMVNNPEIAKRRKIGI